MEKRGMEWWSIGIMDEWKKAERIDGVTHRES